MKGGARSRSPRAEASAGAGACPCGGPSYAACCGRWHGGALRAQAPDATTLMRSRYTAFVREDAAYLLDTWHASTRPATVEFVPGLRWLGLEVRAARADGDTATVEFVARHKAAARAGRHHEVSLFRRDEDGRWRYVGEAPPVRQDDDGG